MGFVSKLKNILFEEEEVEIPVIEKKEKRNEIVKEYKEAPKKEEVKITSYDQYNDLASTIDEEKKIEQKAYNNETVSERELFKSEKTFNFPAFDEEEFDSYVPKKRATNVLEHTEKQERKKEYKTDYRNSYKRIERPEEPKEVKKFKPSPIISPVYGILDKNYTPDEITTRPKKTTTNSLDLDTVRNKAFGAKENKINDIFIEETKDNILEERLEKSRTIDELLKDSSDEIIDIKNDIEEDEIESFSPIDTLEKTDEKSNELNEDKNSVNDDTLENDLFDLIDSMYENREEDK